MKTGDWVMWGGLPFIVMAEYDADYVYLHVNPDGAQLVHKSELEMVQ
jgi:hypothetical protein